MRKDHLSAIGAMLLAACWAASCTSLSSDCDLLVSCAKYATGGTGGTGGSGGAASTSSSSGGISCQTVADCPASTECATWACEASLCQPTYSKSALSSQVYGDCHIAVCDGMGHKTSIEGDTNIYDDGNDCTDDLCVMGVPSNPTKMARASCGMAGFGMMCDGQGRCVHCLADKDCVNGSVPKCYQGMCVVTTCGNNAKDGTETGIDCGGATCVPCVDGTPCKAITDCLSQVCMGPVNNKICQKPTCFDGEPNGKETDVDCGGPDCVPIGGLCDDNWHCKLGTDCMNGICKSGLCQAPTCTDGVKNGTETGVDCGGSCPTTCPQ